MTSMKLLLLTLYSTFLATSAIPTKSIKHMALYNQNPTIWSQSTVPTMRQEIRNLYNLNVELYNNQTVYGAPHLACTAPELPSYYGTEDVCVEADNVSLFSPDL